MDRGAWWAAIYRVAQSRTQLKWPSCSSSSNAGITGDVGLIPGSGRSPREGHGNPLQSSCLENPMDQEAWWATVHGVAKNQTQLRGLSMHTRRGGGQQGWICGDGVTVPLPPPSNSLHRTNFKSLRQEEEELCQELEKILKKKNLGTHAALELSRQSLSSRPHPAPLCHTTKQLQLPKKWRPRGTCVHAC